MVYIVIVCEVFLRVYEVMCGFYILLRIVKGGFISVLSCIPSLMRIFCGSLVPFCSERVLLDMPKVSTRVGSLLSRSQVKASTWLWLVVFFVFVLAHTITCASPVPTKLPPTLGVSPDQITRYSESTFTCGNGLVIPSSKINDDYCHCNDGSDEPGTSACSHLSPSATSQFWCVNTGHVGEYLPSSRVNDGICDCCDGSDEYTGPSPRCTNTCEAKRKEQLATVFAELESEEAGNLQRGGLEEQALTRANDLEKQMNEMRAKLAAEEALLAEARNAKEREEALERAEKEALDKSVEETTSLAPAPAPTPTSTSTPVPDASAATDAGAIQPVASTTEGASSPAPSPSADSAASAFPYPKEYAFPAEGTPAPAPASAPAPAPTPESFPYPKEYAYQGDELDEDRDLTPEEILHEEADEAAHEEALDEADKLAAAVGLGGKDSTEFPKSDSKPKPSESHQRAEAVAARAQSSKLEETVEDARKSLQTLEDEAKHLKSAVDEAKAPGLFALRNQCFTIDQQKYTYETCFFGSSSQKEGASSTSLGKFTKFTTDASGAIQMHFENGQTCWNGPARSLTVTFQCGATPKVLSVNEPSKCVYAMTMALPVACSPTRLEQLRHIVGPR